MRRIRLQFLPPTVPLPPTAMPCGMPTTDLDPFPVAPARFIAPHRYLYPAWRTFPAADNSPQLVRSTEPRCNNHGRYFLPGLLALHHTSQCRAAPALPCRGAFSVFAYCRYGSRNGTPGRWILLR